ncbi:DUF2339 domain-containing protein [Enterobacillus tribolii]|uniref:Putative membrane protein n=1 Tax=Enterobacillus tribolii TaxID=1487935 RepID=A0A370R2D4_9GAMM|nr:DUF2339 domain-containing protein [Enterobacillus tribolii]MBW7983662.1 DUF2339 domain-containing protein [Enterobacillus tribolii]RDK96590.1 putative membrane protein [Enterobacillus tribolii]
MEGLLFLAGLVIVFSLLIMPIMVLISLGRGRRNQEELERLRQKVETLQRQFDERQQVPVPQPAVAPQPAAAPRLVKAETPPAPVLVPAAAAPPAGVALDKTPKTGEPSPAAAGTAPPASASPWDSEPQPKSKPVPPPPDDQPDMFSGLLSGLLAWFMKGNPLAKLGVLLLFFGLAYLLKYTVERDMLPIELRLTGAALASMVLLVLGWRLRLKQPVYALILQGGAVGALYITVFGAFKLYELLPHLLAFGLMLVICAASVGLAVLQRALSLAMLASIGGYLSPLLLSTGSGNHVALFSYYLLLSLGILAITVWQPWRPLNLLGFAFTFGVAGLWGMNGYQPEDYLSCQLFLIANVVIFGVLCLALSLRYHVAGEKVIDGVLLFGPPLVGFGMQYAITRHWTFGPAFSALGFGLAYLLLAWAGLRRYPALGRQLAISGLALGGAFTTLAIPLALSAEWTSMAWALEGLGILWLGHTQRQMRVSYSGTGLLVLALGSALTACANSGMSSLTFALIFGILSLTWLAASWLWRGTNDAVSRGLLGGGIVFWLLALAGALDLDIIDIESFLFPLLGLVALSALAWHLVSRRLSWPELGLAQWLLWPAMLAVLMYQLGVNDSLHAAGWFNLIWLPVLAVAYWLLKREEETPKPPALERGLHLSLFWMLLLGIGSEVWWQVRWLPWGMDEWRIAALMMFIALTMLLTLWALKRGIWPFAAHPRLYGALGLAPLAPFALLFLVMGNLHDGVMIDWRYLPLINPLEEGAMFVLLALIFWGRFLRRTYAEAEPWLTRALPLFVAAMLFWWGNGMILRALSYYADISWRVYALWPSRLVQTTFALLWMLAALVVMLWSTRHRSRQGWFSGAALLGIVIVKLMLVDSARGGGLARAVAFIGVAVLVLIIGYFSPLPPKAGREEDVVVADEGKNENKAE